MRPTNPDITVRGDLGGSKTLMTIDENSLVHLMSVLTDLYSDPEMAVIREYSTNAWDSHVLVGNTDPIEVTLPTAMSPNFIIQDFGVGLSVNDITDMYSKYGASTKRDSDDFNGTLGLGAKSGLTYCSQFVMESVHNGIKVVVSISRNESGAGQMEIVDTCSTTERNSVKIILPSSNHMSLSGKARKFFSFWPAGTVLINGELNTDPEWIKISDNLFIDTSIRQDFIVMGNVAYPLSGNGLQSRQWKNFGVIAYVEIGDVNFAPSREALQYTARTKSKIDQISKQYERDLEIFITNEISTAATAPEAMAARAAWRRRLDRTFNSVTWRRQTIPDEFTIQDGAKAFYPQRSRYATETVYRIDASAQYVFILNYPGGEISSSRKSKIRRWIGDKNITGSVTVVALEDSVLFGSPWTDDMTTVDWADIAAIKLNNGPRVLANGRVEKYDIVAANGTPAEASTFSGSDIVYVSPAERDRHNYKFNSYHLRQMFPKSEIAIIGANRFEKFERDWPTAKHIATRAKEMLTEAFGRLSEDDLTKMAMPAANESFLTAVKKDDIIDPEFRHQWKILRTPYSKEYQEYMELSRRLNKISWNLFHAQLPDVVRITDKYPLVSDRHVNHSVKYMNAVYNGSI